MSSSLGRRAEVFTALCLSQIYTLCQGSGGVLQRGEGVPSSGSPLEAQSDYWFRLTADPVALQHRRYFGGPSGGRAEKKKVLLAFPTKLFETQHLRFESCPMPEILFCGGPIP